MKEAVQPRRWLVAVHDLADHHRLHQRSQWLRPCLGTLFEHLGELRADIVVVDNDSHDETRELVAGEFPTARVVSSRNHGFSHANNRALMTCNARYVLFLNPDTEVLEGTFERPRSGDGRAADGRADRGAAGHPRRADSTKRSATSRTLCARWARPWPPTGSRAGRAGSGSGSSIRRPTTARQPATGRAAPSCSPGGRRSRARATSTSATSCTRTRQIYAGGSRRRAGRVRHLPSMTILHHDGKAGVKPNIVSLGAWTRLAYARKYFSPVHRAAYCRGCGSGAFPAVGLRRARRTGSPAQAGQPPGGRDHVGPGPRAVWTPEQGLPAHGCARAPRRPTASTSRPRPGTLSSHDRGDANRRAKRADHGGRGTVGLRSRGAARATAAAFALRTAPSWTSARIGRWRQSSSAPGPTSCSTAPRFTTWRSASARRIARSRSTRARSSASPSVARALGRRWCT